MHLKIVEFFVFNIKISYNLNYKYVHRVISPIFFSIYNDPLLLQLRNSVYGCHLNRVYYGGPLLCR